MVKNMKTAKIMVRDFGIGKIRQNHKTGMVNLTDLLQAGNVKRVAEGKQPRRMTVFMQNKDVAEYVVMLANLANLEALDQFQPVIQPSGVPYSDSGIVERYYIPEDFVRSKSGRNGGTWAHPFLAIKLAAYLDKEFEIKMHAAMYDNLLKMRDAGGDSYMAMRAEFCKRFKLEEDDDEVIWLARAVQIETFGEFTKGAWETAGEKQLKKRDDLHNEIRAVAKHASYTDPVDFIHNVVGPFFKGPSDV